MLQVVSAIAREREALEIDSDTNCAPHLGQGFEWTLDLVRVRQLGLQ